MTEPTTGRMTDFHDPQPKPRDHWDRDDYLDYLDGWHSEGDPNFKSTRDLERATGWRVDTNGGPLHGGSSQFFESIARLQFDRGVADRKAGK